MDTLENLAGQTTPVLNFRGDLLIAFSAGNLREDLGSRRDHAHGHDWFRARSIRNRSYSAHSTECDVPRITFSQESFD
jgi:hypothetical protein